MGQHPLNAATRGAKRERAAHHLRRRARGAARAAGAVGALRGDEPARNLWNWWLINPQPYPEAHFATFPEKLVEPCILAGTSEWGCCPECGAPWERVVETKYQPVKYPGGIETPVGEPVAAHKNEPKASVYGNSPQAWSQGRARRIDSTTGWRPTCDHEGEPDAFEVIATPTGQRVGDDPSLVTGRAGYNRPRGKAEGVRLITRYEQRRYAEQLKSSPHRAEMEAEAGPAFAHYVRSDKSGARPLPPEILESWIERGWLEGVDLPPYEPHQPVPCTVLDPFAGSGTVGVVAARLGRRAVLIDANPSYCELARHRTRQMGLFTAVGRSEEG